MWASKIGYCAAASRGPPRTSRAAASETSGPRAVIAGILSRGPSRDAGRPARPTRAVADALRIGDRGEDHAVRSEEHTSELQSQFHLVCRLLLEKKKTH